MTDEIKRYIKEKTAVLAEFNLTYEYAVSAYLKSKVDNNLPDEFNIIRIDRAAREMVNDYWAGDRSFCKRYSRKEN